MVFQFTHPRGVRFGVVQTLAAILVSIHAPARGAIVSCRDVHFTYLFQFTHPRGVRFRPASMDSQGSRFNSRTREGCDDAEVFAIGADKVSIHAPARGAMKNKSCLYALFGFNSRTREGCDLGWCLRSIHRTVSIHAPARGAMGAMKRLGQDLRFNSRTREGCDRLMVCLW